MLLAVPLLVLINAAQGTDAPEQPPPAQTTAAQTDLASSDADNGEDTTSAPAAGATDDSDGYSAERCPELSGPQQRQDRHATWRAQHQVDVTYGADTWEIAMRGEFPSEIRSGLFEDAEIVDVQPVVTDDGGPLEWVAVVELEGELAELCDAEHVALRLDDGFGRGAHVIALHPAGVLLRARDRGLVFLSAEDNEQMPDIELVYSSSFELVNAPKASKPKTKGKKKSKKKRRRGRRRR
jgi:hypothetical protein